MYYMDFNNTNKPGNKPAQPNSDKTGNDKAETRFWSFIDAKLEKLQRKSVTKRLKYAIPKPDILMLTLYLQFRSLDNNLTRDKQLFPAPKAGAPAVVLGAGALPEWQVSVGRAVLTMDRYQSEAPPAEVQANSEGAVSRRQPNETREPPPVASTSSPTHVPEAEQEQEEEDQESKETPPRRDVPMQVQSYGSRMDGTMDVDQHYDGECLDARENSHKRFPYLDSQHQTPINPLAPSHTATVARRGAGTGLGIRGDPIRHNPIAPSSRLTTSSTIMPIHARNLRSRTLAMGVLPTHAAETIQYDPHFSDTAGATLGLS
jgi:hypothetical protein